MPRPTLAALRKASERATKATAAAATALATRDALALDVYEAATLDAPVTYNDVAEAMGVTRDRVRQVLAEQRTARSAD